MTSQSASDQHNSGGIVVLDGRVPLMILRNLTLS